MRENLHTGDEPILPQSRAEMILEAELREELNGNQKKLAQALADGRKDNVIRLQNRINEIIIKLGLLEEDALTASFDGVVKQESNELENKKRMN